MENKDGASAPGASGPYASLKGSRTGLEGQGPSSPGLGGAAVRTHTVTVSIDLPKGVPHGEVQARVLEAVGRLFPEREGVLSVSGFDRRGLERELEKMTNERNELHAAWLGLKRTT
jgi:hypothetical protein